MPALPPHIDADIARHLKKYQQAERILNDHSERGIDFCTFVFQRFYWARCAWRYAKCRKTALMNSKGIMADMAQKERQESFL
jgi:hypothetical protein